MPPNSHLSGQFLVSVPEPQRHRFFCVGFCALLRAKIKHIVQMSDMRYLDIRVRTKEGQPRSRGIPAIENSVLNSREFTRGSQLDA